MSVVHDDGLQADGQLRLAILRLAREFPFHTATLERIDLEPREDIPTVGVTVRSHTIVLAYRREFVLSLSMDELGAVLLHEVHHLLFGHVTADPDAFPDAWARIVAEEVTVNEYISLPLPAGAILLADYPQLPPRESTRQRYERLRHEVKREPVEPPSESASGPGDGAGQGDPARRPGVRSNAPNHRRPVRTLRISSRFDHRPVPPRASRARRTPALPGTPWMITGSGTRARLTRRKPVPRSGA